MSRSLEGQLKLSLRGILSKQFSKKDKHLTVASFISDTDGFSLAGLERKDDGRIIEMEISNFEEICAEIPTFWEQFSKNETSEREFNIADFQHVSVNLSELTTRTVQKYKIKRVEGFYTEEEPTTLNFLIVGLSKENNNVCVFEIMITKLDKFFLSTVYRIKKK